MYAVRYKDSLVMISGNMYTTCMKRHRYLDTTLNGWIGWQRDMKFAVGSIDDSKIDLLYIVVKRWCIEQDV
jgi:hypothetical protein